MPWTGNTETLTRWHDGTLAPYTMEHYTMAPYTLMFFFENMLRVITESRKRTPPFPISIAVF